MASANTWKPSAAPPSKNSGQEAPSRKESGVPAFLVSLVLLSLLCQLAPRGGDGQGLLLQHGASDFSAGSVFFPLSNLLVHLNGAVAASLPMLGQFVAVVAGAVFIALLWRDVACRCGRFWASALALLIALNPGFTQMLLDGSTQVFVLLGFYGLCRTLRRFQGDVETFTYLRTGGWLCLLLCINLDASLLVLAIAPWLLLVVPGAVLRRAPLSFFMVCYLPVVVVAGGWILVSHFLIDVPWPDLALLRGHGVSHTLFDGRSFAEDWPAVVRWVVAAVIGFPVLLLAWRCRQAFFVRTVMVALGTTLTAAALASLLGLPVEPYLPLLWVPVALLLRGLRPDHCLLGAGLLVFGLVGGSLAWPHGMLLSTGRALQNHPAVLMPSPVDSL